MDIPPKVRIFIWKAAHDIVATEGNLVRHHVPSNSRCAYCGFFWSDTTHALLFCKGIKGAWSKSKWWPLIKDLKGQPSLNILHTLAEAMSRVDFEDIYTNLWGLRKDRCTRLHKEFPLGVPTRMSLDAS